MMNLVRHWIAASITDKVGLSPESPEEVQEFSINVLGEDISIESAKKAFELINAEVEKIRKAYGGD